MTEGRTWNWELVTWWQQGPSETIHHSPDADLWVESAALPSGAPSGAVCFQPGPPASGTVTLLINALFACFNNQTSRWMKLANALEAVQKASFFMEPQTLLNTSEVLQMNCSNYL